MLLKKMKITRRREKKRNGRNKGKIEKEHGKKVRNFSSNFCKCILCDSVIKTQCIEFFENPFSYGKL